MPARADFRSAGLLDSGYVPPESPPTPYGMILYATRYSTFPEAQLATSIPTERVEFVPAELRLSRLLSTGAVKTLFLRGCLSSRV